MTAALGGRHGARVVAAAALSVAIVFAGCGGATEVASPPDATAGATAEAGLPSEVAATSSPDAPASEAPGTAAPTVSTDQVDAIDACSLLTVAEVAQALGVTADRIEPLPGGALVPGIRTCFYRPPGVGDGPQLLVAVLAAPDISRPASPSPVPDLGDVAGTWWFEAMTGDLKVEAFAPSGVRLTFSYQDTSAGPPTDAALTFLAPLVRQALARLP